VPRRDVCFSELGEHFGALDRCVAKQSARHRCLGFSQLGLPAPFVFQRCGGASAMKLIDRRAECGMLDRLVKAAYVGERRTAIFKITVKARSRSC
jgi:hypothetical protein